MPIVQMIVIWLLGSFVGFFLNSFATTTATNTLASDRTYLFRRAADIPAGVSVHNESMSMPGYTIYTSGHEQGARLVDAKGNLVHSWTKPYSEIHDKTSHVQTPRTDDRIYWRKAKLFENGDLLVVFEGDFTLPFGYGLVKVDKDSKVLWKFLENVHHDVEVGEDGRIYTLTQTIEAAPPEEFDFLTKRATVYDAVVILSANGEVEKRIELFSAFAQSEFFDRIKPRVRSRHDELFNSDYLHANSVEPLTEAGASRIPNAKAGDVLVSFRDIDTIGVISVETGAFIWVANGPWRRQHDPDQLPNGNILLFDNEGDFSGAGISRIVEYDPVLDEVVWTYTGTREDPLESFVRSAQQMLPNGNVLITESDRGRILEVTRDGELVWEFGNPVRRQQDDFVAVVSWAERFEASALDFTFNNSSTSIAQ